MAVLDKENRRAVALALVLFAGTAGFLAFVHGHYPIWRWLFWRYLGYWTCALLGAGAWLALGHVVVRRLLRTPLRPHEHLCVAFLAGKYLFEVLVFLAGLLGLYGELAGVRPLFFLLPAACLALGGPSLLRLLGRWRVATRPFRTRRDARARPPLSAWARLAVVLGLVALGMIYFLILTPENAQFDARWKHLRIAEEFLIHGGFRVFPEGWTFATRPHMTSYLYLWAMMVPGGRLFDQVLAAAHVEFVVFLWTTLVGLPALVRRLVPGADPRVVWAARLLFPGVFLYDSSLSVGADHIGAAYCVPLFLLVLACARALEPRRCALLGGMLGAAAVVKDTSAIMLGPPVVVTVGALALRQIWGARGAGAVTVRVTAALGAAIACAAITTAPHWLKNWVAYGNPIYPLAGDFFPSRPWTPDAAYQLGHGYQSHFWRPERSLAGLGQTALALLDWSFVPNDWSRFHGRVPVIGSLFTLLLPCLLLLRGARRSWLLVGWCHLAIASWYWVHHQDRYLQGIMPWLAAVTAAVLVHLWRHPRGYVRVPAIALCAAQIVWGGDVYFFQTHAMAHSPIKKVNDLLSAGFEKKYDERLSIGQDSFVRIGQILPEGARVVMHETHHHLGLGRASISDYPHWQYGLSYGLLGSPRALHARLRELGATHLVWGEESHAWDSLAGDLLFHHYATRYGVELGKVGHRRVAALPEQPPPEDARSFDDRVAILGCGKEHRTGLYRVEDLRTPMWGPLRTAYPAARVLAESPEHGLQLAREQAAFLLVDPACAERFAPDWQAGFEPLFKRRKSNRGIAYEAYRRAP